MKTLFGHPAARLAIVVIAATGWFELSNHCALVAIQGATKAPMSCHGSAGANRAPAKDKGSDVVCCKVVRATLLTPAEGVASPNELLLPPAKFFVAVLVLPEPREQSTVFEWDTGPPGINSFAESVLQRSILAHAPPLSLS